MLMLLELAESVAEGVEGKIIYCIDDDEVEKFEIERNVYKDN